MFMLKRIIITPIKILARRILMKKFMDLLLQTLMFSLIHGEEVINLILLMESLMDTIIRKRLV